MHDNWTRGIEPVDGAGNIYGNLVDAFAEVLPAISIEQRMAAREAGRLLARAIVCADRVLDADVGRDAAAESLLAALVCEFEGVRVLLELVPPRHAFWDAMAARLREHAAACLDEARACPPDVSIAVAERVAAGKNALARLAGTAVCAIAEAPELAPVFDAAVASLIVAVQALDDAVDWRPDLAARRLSLITARIWTAVPADIDRFVYSSAIPEVLAQGRAALASAYETPALAGSASWRRLTGRIVEGYDRALALFVSAEHGRNTRTRGAAG